MPCPFSLGSCFIAELSGPFAHPVQTGPVGIYIGDRAGRTGRCAGRAGDVVVAEVALLHLAGGLHIIHGAERAGDRANFAADTDIVLDDLGAGDVVDADRIHRTCMQAPGFIALRAGVGNLGAGVMKVEHLDA